MTFVELFYYEVFNDDVSTPRINYRFYSVECEYYFRIVHLNIRNETIMACLKFWRDNRRDMKWRTSVTSVQPVIPYRFEDKFVLNVTHKLACWVSCRNALREDRNGDLKFFLLRFTVPKTAEVILKEFAKQIACFLVWVQSLL